MNINTSVCTYYQLNSIKLDVFEKQKTLICLVSAEISLCFESINSTFYGTFWYLL